MSISLSLSPPSYIYIYRSCINHREPLVQRYLSNAGSLALHVYVANTKAKYGDPLHDNAHIKHTRPH